MRFPACTTAGLNVFAFDYRGYGQSHFAHPSETRWREDAESALSYLTGTRHIPANAIILVGKDLGANLALEVAVSSCRSRRSGARSATRISNRSHFQRCACAARSGASAGERPLADNRRRWQLADSFVVVLF